MPSSLFSQQHDVALSHAALRLPLLLFAASLIAYLGTPVKHSLLTSAFAWLAVCARSTYRSGNWRGVVDGAPGQKIAWAAGVLFALGSVSERAVEGRGIWWAKVRTRAQWEGEDKSD